MRWVTLRKIKPVLLAQTRKRSFILLLVYGINMPSLVGLKMETEHQSLGITEKVRLTCLNGSFDVVTGMFVSPYSAFSLSIYLYMRYKVQYLCVSHICLG
mmetsp:Transcript_24950/g.68779  ORF Transcript_24950/g.68779 Transcript_24950/m.68779 type:complete len:100 (-) Transcript_24950:2184-2483(-)